MPRPRRLEYDSEEFRIMWMNDVSLHEMAKRFGVSIPMIWQAAMRRGLPPKFQLRDQA